MRKIYFADIVKAETKLDVGMSTFELKTEDDKRLIGTFNLDLGEIASKITGDSNEFEDERKIESTGGDILALTV